MLAGRMVKRALDIGLSLSFLVLISPLLLITSLAVLLDVGWPVLFVQERSGLMGTPFRLRKFRTMRNAYGADGAQLPDGERLTTLGALLRRWSIDELPGLWNVLVGEMSLVGPRPLLMLYLPLYSEHQAKRLLVKPGLTGLAQVSGRNALSWEEKFDLDVYYVQNWSLALDLHILFKTIRQVVSGHGIGAKGHATMPPFTGSDTRVRGF